MVVQRMLQKCLEPAKGDIFRAHTVFSSSQTDDIFSGGRKTGKHFSGR
jgi:hypothetical protein